MEDAKFYNKIRFWENSKMKLNTEYYENVTVVTLEPEICSIDKFKTEQPCGGG